LQRHPPVERRLNGLVHDAHPPASQLADDLEVSQTFSLQVSRHRIGPPQAAGALLSAAAIRSPPAGSRGCMASGIPSVYVVAARTDRVAALGWLGPTHRLQRLPLGA